jgi:hypothetical protein
MFCWEIDRRVPDSVLVATLWPREGASGDWCASWKSLKLPGADVNWMRLMGLPFGEARTQAAATLLQQDKQWLFFLDSDVLVPAETVMRFINYRVPIISALYPQRYPTFNGVDLVYKPCIFNEGRDAQGNAVTADVGEFQFGQILEVAYAPSGCMLIHRSVYERLLQNGIRDFYEWTMKPMSNPHGRSEDFDFCAKARSVGYKILVDTGVQATHEVMANITVRTGMTTKVS